MGAPLQNPELGNWFLPEPQIIFSLPKRQKPKIKPVPHLLPGLQLVCGFRTSSGGGGRNRTEATRMR